MSTIWAIYKKELRTYFTTPIAYVVLAVFTLITGFFFDQYVKLFQRATMQYMQFQNPKVLEQLNMTDLIARPVVMNIGIILVFMTPLLTMRLLAEERKMNTFELIMTAPITLWQIIVGKFTAAFTVVFLMTGVTFLYPVSLDFFAVEGSGVGWNTVISSYVGLLLVSAAFVAVGLLASSVTENQIVAAVISFVTLLLLWVVNWAAQSASGVLQDVLANISFIEHMQNFSKGLIEVKSVVFFVTFTFFGLFLTYRVLESQRYAGS